MTTPQIQTDAVKAALASPNLASLSTVATLQSLLSQPAAAKIIASQPQTGPRLLRRTGPKGRNVRAAALERANAKATNETRFEVHEDAPRRLLPKACYKLATDVVNISLRSLTDALKPQPKAHRRVSSARTSGPASPKHARTSSSPASLRTLIRTPSQRALQLRSANDGATPACSVGKPSGFRRTSSYTSSAGKIGPSPGITAIAECASLGLAYLRKTSTQKLGARELPTLQLETGMLALAGKMITHDLQSLAVRELRILKKRLENHMETTANRISAETKNATPAEKETVAKLLHLNMVDIGSDVLPLVISYQTHVLRIIASQRWPVVVEAAVAHLELTNAGALANIILQQATASGDVAKSAMQLEQHAQTLLSLCPCSSADEVALDAKLSPSPEAVIRLQCLALQVRKHGWTLSKHQVKTETDLLEPFAKSLAAFARQSTLEATDRYKLAKKVYKATLDEDSTLPADFRISRTMSTMAQSAGQPYEALLWASNMRRCDGVIQARKTAALIRLATLELLSWTPGASDDVLQKLLETLRAVSDSLSLDNFTSSVSDVDVILAELTSLRNEIVGLAVGKRKRELPDTLELSSRQIVYSAINFVNQCSARLPIDRQSTARKAFGPLLDTAIYFCKSAIIDATADETSIEEVLKSCLAIRHRLLRSEHSTLGGSVLVRVSHMYWLWSQTFKSSAEDDQRHQRRQCLQRSVDALSGASQAEQEAGYLTSKLEALAGLVQPDEAQQYIRKAVELHIKSGSLTRVAGAADSRSLKGCWTTDEATVTLRRSLRLYVRNMLGSAKDATHFDDQTLPLKARGVLLELQVQVLAESSDRAKYQPRIACLLSRITPTLLSCYTKDLHPLRRARSAVIILRLADVLGGLLEEKVVNFAQTTTLPESGALAQDQGLALLYDGVKASLDLAKALHSQPQPDLQALRPSLLSWQMIVDNAESPSALLQHIDDLDAFVTQLESVAVYLAMQGEDVARAVVLRLLARLHEFSGNADEECAIAAQLSIQYLRLGFSEKANHMLVRAQKLACQDDVAVGSKFKVQIANSEYLLAIYSIEKSQGALDQAEQCLILIDRDGVPRFTVEQAHADFALLHSRLQLEAGSALTALAEAKRAAKLLSMLWSVLEHDAGDGIAKAASSVFRPVEEEDPTIEVVTSKVSKLSLVPEEKTTPVSKTLKGAVFWSLVPTLVMAMLHLSGVYAHHGLFAEAKYYSDHAIKITESVGSNLLSRARSHRAQLLVSAGKPADAELCLTQEADEHPHPLAGQVERHIAMASLRGAEQSWSDALWALEMAENTIAKMSLLNVDTLEIFQNTDNNLASQMAVLSLETTTKAKERPAARSLKASARGKTVNSVQKSSPRPTRDDNHRQQCHQLERLQTRIRLQKAAMFLQLGKSQQATDTLSQIVCSTKIELLQRGLMEFRVTMRQASKAMQSDFTFSVLPESTIAFPSLARPERRPSELGTSRSSPMSLPQKLVARMPSPSRGKKIVKSVNESLAGLIKRAKDCVDDLQIQLARSGSTAAVHQLHWMLLQSTILVSATSAAQAKNFLYPERAAYSANLPSNHALRCELGSSMLDRIKDTKDGLLTVQRHPAPGSSDSSSAAAFYKDYVDIIPKAWTVVSMSLSEVGDELYLTRYRSGQTPFILRQPLSRHNPEDPSQEPFNFTKGRAELREIIELSDYSCHAINDTGSKGAKRKWWNEREALDSRMHELLINIEQIWLGGFRGVFSLHQRNPELLARFRNSFDSILDQHLPSRKAMKKTMKKAVLDHRVLELFLGLENDQSGVVDLDEPVADLLYFVVDILQFSGERNAYDEIDFDSMTVEVLEVIRACHEAFTVDEIADQHLILVVDKPLHAFPWESMPCLEGVSISRVGSMLSLRQRILAMQRQLQITLKSPSSEPEAGKDTRYIVPRTSGTYILNPSSDLRSTQDTLTLPLAELSSASSSDTLTSWTPIINRAPTETDFQAALSSSSILLYFGHGAGSQYIRPRTIKKLDRCSEVVWLMGCSSGAVTEYGQLEPQGVPLTYLLAGHGPKINISASASERQVDDEGLATSEDIRPCMAIVATLWDVTDKDIDRFSVTLGEEWGLWPSSEWNGQQVKMPKTPKRKTQTSAPETPQQPPKTPKTPKAAKSLVMTKTPARSLSRTAKRDGRKRSLPEAVARSRDACYLRYLNGAASVVYGVPVWLGD